MEGALISDVNDVVEVLADSFSSVFDENVPVNPYPHQVFAGQMGSIIIDYNVVFQALSCMDPTSSPGPNGLHPQFLKACAGVLAFPLSMIFKQSLATGSIPSVWKKSLVSPIFKSGSRSVPLNY